MRNICVLFVAVIVCGCTVPQSKPTPLKASALDTSVVKNMSGSDVGKSYDSLEDLQQDQEAKGYVFTKKFGDDWPATVTESRTEMSGISFEMKKEGPGLARHYSGFDGYEVKMLRLNGSNDEEIIVVLRSKDKK